MLETRSMANLSAMIATLNYQRHVYHARPICRTNLCWKSTPKSEVIVGNHPCSPLKSPGPPVAVDSTPIPEPPPRERGRSKGKGRGKCRDGILRCWKSREFFVIMSVVDDFPSSRNHGSGKWVPPIWVSFHLGWFSTEPWSWIRVLCLLFWCCI